MQALAVTRTSAEELDELTLRRAQRGDHAAFRRLVERYHGPVYQLIWRLIEHRCGQGRVEELTQETFLRVFRGLAGFRPEGTARLSTWILTIATRLAWNELRRPAQAVSLEASTAEPATSAADPERALQQRQLAEVVARALGRLGHDQRAVLVLREYHGLTYEEIAEALRLDLNTVKSRLWRARSALREALVKEKS